MRNHDWVKPECLAVFPIESYSFSSVLIIIRLSLPLSCCLVVEGAVPVSARVCDFDPRKTCLAELGRARKEGTCRGVGKSRKLEVQL